MMFILSLTNDVSSYLSNATGRWKWVGFGPQSSKGPPDFWMNLFTCFWWSMWCCMKLPHHDCVICVVCGHFGAHVGLLAFSSVSFLQSSVEKSPFMCSSQWSGTMYLCSCYLRSWSMVCLIVKEAKNLSVSSCSLCPICLVEYSERIKWPLNSIT